MLENDFKNSCKYKLKIVVWYQPMRSIDKVLEQNIIYTMPIEKSHSLCV